MKLQKEAAHERPIRHSPEHNRRPEIKMSDITGQALLTVISCLITVVSGLILTRISEVHDVLPEKFGLAIMALGFISAFVVLGLWLAL